MIISPGRGYIFVHIPKTGGTSMALALEDRAMMDDILIGDTPKAKRRKGRLTSAKTAGRLWKHSTLADIEGDLVPGALEDYFVFTMVRNPWDRLVSYYHWLQEQSFDHPAVHLAKSTEFGAFLDHPETEAAFRAQTYASYVTTRGAEHCASFLRLEYLDEDIETLEAHLGFSLRPLSHENRSKRPSDYRSCYSQRAAERVADLCAQDIARFGYVF